MAQGHEQMRKSLSTPAASPAKAETNVFRANKPPTGLQVLAESLICRHLPNVRSPWTGGGASPRSLAAQCEDSFTLRITPLGEVSDDLQTVWFG